MLHIWQANTYCSRFARVMTADLRSQRKDIRFIDLIASAVQGFIIIIFLLLIAEMTLGTSYDLFMLILVTIVSNGLAAVVMFYLFKRLLAYYKSHSQYAISVICDFGLYNINNSVGNNIFHGSYIVVET